MAGALVNYISHDGSQMWYRDGNGAGGWQSWKQIATVDGNVATASKLQAPRNINGVPFDETSDISISASGDTRFQICGNGCNDTISNVGPNCLNLSYFCLSKLDTGKALYLKRLIFLGYHLYCSYLFYYWLRRCGFAEPKPVTRFTSPS
jgi:hypothetical protein